MTISPSGRWAQPPTIRPSHHTVGPTLPYRSNSSGTWAGSRYQSRCRQPIGVGSSAGSRAAPGRGAAGASTCSGRAWPGPQASSTSTACVRARALRVSVRVQPVHHRRSSVVTGPKAPR
ncbi:hypothetical protein VR44_12325 [Streptomyces katrae]|uniref:Uncharacterized protein n=1 Tax=Streptomyces katrae TaxID=68223 RepID=A0A0F4JIR7_9ACTN|nr:hypothetical protein VR44_12325 [Streptomyces katrae]